MKFFISLIPANAMSSLIVVQMAREVEIHANVSESV
jgi:hypothetical protein